MKKNNKGFTLVELIVVLVILAILAAILVPADQKVTHDADWAAELGVHLIYIVEQTRKALQTIDAGFGRDYHEIAGYQGISIHQRLAARGAVNEDVVVHVANPESTVGVNQVEEISQTTFSIVHQLQFRVDIAHAVTAGNVVQTVIASVDRQRERLARNAVVQPLVDSAIRL